MACDKSKEMIFAVYELYPDGKEHDTGRTFTIDKQKNDELMKKIRWEPSSGIDDYGIVLALFTSLYTFDIGPNGFSIRWDNNERFTSGYLYWPGPRAPACAIGGNWWKIKRIT